MTARIDRRDFMRGAGAVGAGLMLTGSARGAARRDKLNIASFGVGGRGWSNVSAMAGENVVALCDVDDLQAQKAREKYPDALFFNDYRALLAEVGDKLDAVTISTPDHMHAPIAVAAMERGLHVYCEKPLTWSIEEARVLRMYAEEKGLVTQMGNQGTAQDGFRTGVELLRARVLGAVREVHIWTNRPVWPQALPTPTEIQPVPKHIDWYLWLGCAPDRPFHQAYLPFKWRGWYDYGCGALGDMACHTVNLAYMGLELDAPTRVVAESTPLFDDCYPAGCRITFDFPARGEREALKLVWYDGTMRPPADLLEGREMPGSGCLILGERGSMFSPDDYGRVQEIRLADGAQVPTVAPTLPRSPGHHEEWLAAIRGDGKTLSNFSHAGPFTEAVLLGNLALRVGKPIDWDAKRMVARGCPEAEALIRRQYRPGFSI